MASRFLLIVALAKLLEPSEVGIYGLLMVSITYCVLILGAEFHSYTMREINVRNSRKWSFVVQHHAFVQVALFMLLFPLVLLVFVFGIIPLKYIYWFSALLFLELLNQEIHWLLISMQKQVLSSITMFIRAGIWVYIVLPIMYLKPELNNIQSVLLAWAIGGTMAVIIGGGFVYKSVPTWKAYKVDKRWMKNGLKVGSGYLLASLSLRGLFTFDKFTINLLGATDELGVYVFYMSVVMGAINFLEPAVFSFIYPRLIQCYHKEEKESFSRLFNELAVSTWVISLVIATVIWIVMPYLIDWINKPIYYSYFTSLKVIIAMGVVSALAMIPHYGLYSMKNDKWIILSQVSSLIVYLLVVTFYNGDTAIMTVSIALLVAVSWMAIIKLIGYRHISKNNSFLIIG